jgi:hypothetical protein
MEISRKLYERLEEEGLSVRDDYSGRCMFGRTCFGIVVDNIATAIYDLENTLQSIIDEDPESDLADDAESFIEYDEFDACSTDNMGLQYIVYFTDITVAKEDE